MTSMKTIAGWAVLLFATAMTVASAADLGVMETQRLGQIEFMSGGVGEDELAGMRALALDYNLKIVTATPSGAYLAGLDLAVTDAGGSLVLSTSTRGPLFYARLPEGRYVVKISAGSQVQERAVQVGSGTSPEIVMTIGAAPPERATARPAEPASGRVRDNAAAAQRARIEDRGISLYDLDPNAAARAKAQVNRYEVYPDGTTRQLGPADGAPAPSENDAELPSSVEPVQPGSVDPSSTTVP